MLTQEIIRELIDYNPETGETVWRERDVKWFKASNKFSAEIHCDLFNRRRCGKPVFTAVTSKGYRRGKLIDGLYMLHRIIWVYMTGEWPDQVDHINGDKSDHRWVNLRNASQTENQKNRPMQKNNTTGYTGVGRSRKGASKPFVAYIGHKKKTITIGYFDSAEEAYAARLAKAKELGFTDRHGIEHSEYV